jgi:hypothetical protein
MQEGHQIPGSPSLEQRRQKKASEYISPRHNISQTNTCINARDIEYLMSIASLLGTKEQFPD